MMKNRFGARHAVACLLMAAGVVVASHRATADAPAGRYTLQNGGMPTGTVLDTKTGLTWQQAVPSTGYTWSAATSYCTSNTPGLPGSGWRLPSLLELQTIVDDSRVNPAIDPTAFPGTPTADFWTSSAYVGNASFAWVVFFSDGYTGAGGVGYTVRVRCVR